MLYINTYIKIFLHNTYTLQTLNQEKQHEFFALNSSLDLEHKP